MYILLVGGKVTYEHNPSDEENRVRALDLFSRDTILDENAAISQPTDELQMSFRSSQVQTKW